MTPDTLALLHEHYRDTCGGMAEQRGKRDRYFYLVLVVLAIALFDLTAPEGLATTVADVLKARLGLSVVPNLSYVRSILWVLLLGLTVRYGQAALGLERLYIYLATLEEALSSGVGVGFRREGEAYRDYDPVFLKWAHHLYTLVFPVVLAVVVVVWAWRQNAGLPQPLGSSTWSAVAWFNWLVTMAILATIGMYLHAFHFYDRQRAANRPGGGSAYRRRSRTLSRGVDQGQVTTTEFGASERESDGPGVADLKENADSAESR